MSETRLPVPVPVQVARNSKGGAHRWLRSGDAIANVLITATMIGLVWGSIWLHLTQQRQELMARAVRDSGNLARAAAESVGQTIAGVDDALRFIRAVYVSDPRHFDLSAWASRANRTHGVAFEFALIGRDGMLGASSLGPVTTPADFSDQDFFRAHLSNNLDRLYISEPILGRKSGRWSVLFTRRISAPDGWFEGVIAASAEPAWLIRLHKTLDIGHGALMLVGTDGVIRALAAGITLQPGRGTGQDIAGSSLLAAARDAGEGSLTWTSPVDGEKQILSFRRLDEYGSIIAVGLDWGDVFAPYERYARQCQIFGACLTLLILLTGGLLLGNTRRLLISRQVLRDAVDAISQGIIMVDAHGRIAVLNRRARELLRLPASPARGKADLRCIAADLGPADGRGPYEQSRGDGRILEVRTHALDQRGTVRTYTDVTERKTAEAKILHLAHHDSLTGLANRRLFTERLAEAVAREGARCAVMCVDLDRFKGINDLFGHVFGDRVLIQAAERLRGLLSSTDVVARFGGDEFFVLHHAADQTEKLAAQFVEILSEPYDIDGQQALLSASAGIALYPHDGGSMDELLTNADTALYRAKEAGRSTFRRYEPAMDIRISERRLLEQDLRNALALNTLSVVYQPVFLTETRGLTGFEALIRWAHPARGWIPSDSFIPVAEESGLISSLGHFVMETACGQALRWPEPLRLAVNLSPKQFLERDLPGHIGTILSDTGLSPERLTVEVTEGVLIDSSDRALSIMSALKAKGVRIALDDFGTGYSSLSYLRRFPFDSIKIDRSFVRSVCDDHGSQAIVRAILTLAHSLGLKVVAEGVETEAQLDWLRSAGCAEIQGFLLGRPTSPEGLQAFLGGWSGAAAHGDAERKLEAHPSG
jgi:diguanylate cyclase (GGDEF)-like protein